MQTLLTVAIIFYLHIYTIQGGHDYRRVRLSDVQTLTLYKGKRTEARRVSSIPQLKCVGGSGDCLFEPDVVQCYNRGSDGIDTQWECKAEMSSKYKFGQLSVSCEGYESPDDPYILAGSCGLEYHLELVDENYYGSTRSKSTFWPFLFKVAFIVIVFFAVKSYLSNNSQGGSGRSTGTGSNPRPPGGGGDGGFFSNFFPGSGSGGGRPSAPPPPGFRPGFTDDDTFRADCTRNQQQNAGTGGAGGFLTGAALGALGGYVFGTRNRRTDTPRTTGNTGWFGGNTTTNTGSSPSSSSTTHTSSGYGGTTRR